MTFDILLYYGIRVKESSTLNEREIFRIFFFGIVMIISFDFIS